MNAAFSQQVKQLFPRTTITQGAFHPELRGAGFTISSNPCGCGSMIMSNNAYGTINPENFDKLMQLYKEDGVGAIITCFGDGYKTAIKRHVEDLGFKELETYPNHRHRFNGQGTYCQTILIRTLT